MAALDELRDRLREIHDLGRAASLLAWDERTMMPRGGAPARAETLATLARVRHEMFIDDEIGALIERARSLEGRWVLVYRYNERKTGQRNQSVRMLAHLMDLGVDGAVPNTAAKKMVLEEAGGDVARAQQAWTVAGLPGSGPVTVGQLEQARAAAREAG